MFKVIMYVLKERLNYPEEKNNEKIKIDIHDIFKSMTTKEFYENVPPVTYFKYFGKYKGKLMFFSF